MEAQSGPVENPELAPLEQKVLRKFGQNVLGITIHSDDWEKDIPLEYFQDDGKDNPFGN
ncbi:MAG: hypothetical protein WB424_00300 [Terracidiphilus sp.]